MEKDEEQDKYVLLGAGPHGGYIILCSCGAVEVTRQPKEWRRFNPCYTKRRCHCNECGSTFPMKIHEADFYGIDRKALLDAMADPDNDAKSDPDNGTKSDPDNDTMSDPGDNDSSLT